METKTIFYKFNNTNQKTEVIKCDLGKAHDLYDIEREKVDNGKSEWTYFDITVNGKLLRSYNVK